MIRSASTTPSPRRKLRWRRGRRSAHRPLKSRRRRPTSPAPAPTSAPPRSSRTGVPPSRAACNAAARRRRGAAPAGGARAAVRRRMPGWRARRKTSVPRGAGQPADPRSAPAALQRRTPRSDPHDGGDVTGRWHRRESSPDPRPVAQRRPAGRRPSSTSAAASGSKPTSTNNPATSRPMIQSDVARSMSPASISSSVEAVALRCRAPGRTSASSLPYDPHADRVRASAAFSGAGRSSFGEFPEAPGSGRRPTSSSMFATIRLSTTCGLALDSDRHLGVYVS